MNNSNLRFKACLVHIKTLKMVKKLEQNDHAVSQKMIVPKIKHLWVLFSIDKAEKCYPLFSEQRKSGSNKFYGTQFLELILGAQQINSSLFTYYQHLLV